MNDQDIIRNMIPFVEETERNIIAEKMKPGAEKKKATKEIINQLEKEIKNADQSN